LSLPDRPGGRLETVDA